METLESVEREGRERLNPSLTNPSWLVLRRRREIFRAWFARLSGRDLDVVDIGGRIQPYRPLLAGRIRRYVAVDLRGTPLVSVLGRAEQLPFGNDRFDVAICTQVLQYVADPRAVITEIHRVLKPGGCLLLSVPAIYPRDSESDRWRFLPGGLDLLLAPFTEREILAEGRSIIGWFRFVNVGLITFVRYPAAQKFFRFTLCPILNLSAEILDRAAGSGNDQFAANYSVWTRK